MSYERKLTSQLRQLPKDISPGFRLQVYEKGQLRANIKWGKIWMYYDLASLTKILFTTPWLVRMVQSNQVQLSHNISRYCEWFRYSQSIKSILNHSAGNVWWLPIYKKLHLDWNLIHRKTELKQLIASQRPKKKKASVYSDVDFLLLGFLMENVLEKDWRASWQLLQEEFVQDKNIFFHVNNKCKHKKFLYAPMGKSRWRKKSLQGEVHDDNTWALGGVAPHAGLFGTIDAVSKVGLKFREIYRGKSAWLQTKEFQKFTQRSLPVARGDWGLGFMMPTKGSASCGQYFSPQSFGHTGFTGTSLWYDPKRDLLVTLLSNRVHFGDKNLRFRKWRPKIHDWIVECL